MLQRANGRPRLRANALRVALRARGDEVEDVAELVQERQPVPEPVALVVVVPVLPQVEGVAARPESRRRVAVHAPRRISERAPRLDHGHRQSRHRDEGGGLVDPRLVQRRLLVAGGQRRARTRALAAVIASAAMNATTHIVLSICLLSLGRRRPDVELRWPYIGNCPYAGDAAATPEARALLRDWSWNPSSECDAQR